MKTTQSNSHKHTIWRMRILYRWVWTWFNTSQMTDQWSMNKTGYQMPLTSVNWWMQHMPRHPIIRDHNNSAIRKEPIARELDWSKENIEIFVRNYWFCTHLWRTGGICSQSAPTMWMQMVEQTRTANRSVVITIAGDFVNRANRVTWPAQKVICCSKLAGFSSLI